jgi:AraC-like DNA-binding protein
MSQDWVSMRHVQRAVVFMKAQGLDWSALLQAGGLQPAELEHGDRPVSLDAIEHMLASLRHSYGSPLLALHMARAIQPATLGALGMLVQACATMSDLLDVAERFNGLMSNVGHTSSIRLPGQFEVRWACLAGGPEFRQHAAQYIIATLATLTRVLVPDISAPISVSFAHPCPVRGDRVREYFDFFGCPVYFDQPFNSILAPAEHLSMRLPHGDALLKDMLERHAQWMLHERQAMYCIVDDVRRLLHTLVLAGRPSKEAVAQQLGLSVSSLHRKLADAGTGYGPLLDEVRLALAQEQLQRHHTVLADIADRLGFSTPQAFMRWFRAQCGQTPGQYRMGLVQE